MLWALYYMPLAKRIGVDGPSVLVEAANGQPLGRVGPLSDAVKRRDFPDMLVKAVLSIEDRRFYSHWGIDPWGIARATQANWAAGGIAEGGARSRSSSSRCRSSAMSATWGAKYARRSRQSGWTFASARMKFSPDTSMPSI